MVVQKINGIELKIKNPYAIVLLPNLVIVKYGEQEQIREEFKKIKEKIENYSENPRENLLTQQAVKMINKYELEVEMPKKEDVQLLLEEFAIIPLPTEQDEFERCLNNSGYLKKKIRMECEGDE